MKSASKRGTSQKYHSHSFGASLPDSFELSDEFKRAIELVEHSRKNLYITGKAGTGKTTLLRYMQQQTKRSHVVLAPTGIAAIHCGGQTIHSFFSFPPKFIQKKQIKKSFRNKNLIQKIELLIIDEASMVRADLMDGIDYALRIARNQMDIPFGGVQVVLFGDLYQLPPIVRDEMSEIYFERYATPFFFSADIFQEIGLESIHLTKNYRQQEAPFMELLDKIRNCSAGKEAITFLNHRVGQLSKEEMEDGITLTPSNRAASVINETRLNKLPGKEFIYRAALDGNFDESAFPTEWELRLKEGARVLMIRNDADKRWVNGNIGEVVALREDGIRVKINGAIHDISKVTWEKIQYSYDRDKDKIVEEVVGSFEQYPIRLAWAMTIHKSQGLTFDKVIVDLDSGAFAHGQVYVALSRCRTLGGLFLKRPVNLRDIIFDARVGDAANLPASAVKDAVTETVYSDYQKEMF